LPFLTDLTLLHAITSLFLSLSLYILGSVTQDERIALCMCEEDWKKVLIVYLSIFIRKLVCRNTLEIKATFLKLKVTWEEALFVVDWKWWRSSPKPTQNIHFPCLQYFLIHFHLVQRVQVISTNRTKALDWWMQCFSHKWHVTEHSSNR
jgi:hypothetical protein